MSCLSPPPEHFLTYARPAGHDGLDKIKHVIFITQENRSFDSYFGTYPGADGIPMKDGVPQVSVPDTSAHTCVAPYHDPALKNVGGPHAQANAAADVAGGRTDGFIRQALTGKNEFCRHHHLPAKKTTAKKTTAKTGRAASPVRRTSTGTIQARRGDLIVIDSPQVGSPPRAGEVQRVIHGEVNVSYQVKWADGHETLISPTAGTVTIVRA